MTEQFPDDVEVWIELAGILEQSDVQVSENYFKVIHQGKDQKFMGTSRHSCGWLLQSFNHILVIGQKNFIVLDKLPKNSTHRGTKRYSCFPLSSLD